MKVESLSVAVSRAKARWLKRVMFESAATDVQKCFAYVVFDHLNCVTLSCWPTQERVAQLLGKESPKSVQRAANGLVTLKLLEIRKGSDGKRHYAPVFLPSDWDNNDNRNGQACPRPADKNVQESSLSNPPQVSAPTTTRSFVPASYDRRQRGALEVRLAAKFGSDGLDVLAKLAKYQDGTVDRLCSAEAAGSLTERDLAAARLAAEQMG